jgi:hypothetical protein
MEPGTSDYREDKSRLPVALAAGAGVVLLLLAGLIFVTRSMRTRSSAAEARLPFGAAEQAYAERIHFLDIQMARATNFLNQEFTYVGGTVSNDGTRTIRALEITLEFHDFMDQVVLRERQQLIGATTRPLEGGQRREFQVTLDHVPAMWNQQYPSIRVSGLILGQ